MNNWEELKRLAEKVRELDVVGDDDHDYDPLDEAIERMQSAANSKNILALIAENDRLKRSLSFTEQWYAVRVERLGDLGRASGIWPEMAAIIANGTSDHQEPPTYAQQLVRANHQAKEVKAERDQLRAEVEALRSIALELRGWVGCADVNHRAGEFHEYDEPCKVLARIDEVLRND